jgi:dynein heavy chain
LKERHWEEISKRVGFPISPERDVAFKKLIDAETVKYAPELEEISENASREYEIEKVLTRMRDDIKPLNAELRAWKDTGTFILSGLFVEEVQ